MKYPKFNQILNVAVLILFLSLAFFGTPNKMAFVFAYLTNAAFVIFIMVITHTSYKDFVERDKFFDSIREHLQYKFKYEMLKIQMEAEKCQ